MRRFAIAYSMGILCALGLLGLSPQRARAQVITLAELERTALGDRPELQADTAAERAADADVARARSAYYPEIGLGVHSSVAPGRQLFSVKPARESEPTILVPGVLPVDDKRSFEPQVRYGAELELRTSLYDFGRTGALVEASRAKRAAVNAHRDVTRGEITRAVRGSYLAWLGASELVSVSERAATEAKERSTRVDALISEGVRPQADLTPARSDELLAELELERARGELDRRKLTLELAVGIQLPAMAIPDRSLLDEKPTPRTSEDAKLRALQLEQAAASKAAEAQGKGRSPVLGATAAAGLEAQSTTFFPIYNVGVSLSIPLWDGGGTDAAESAARARSEGVGAQIRQHEAGSSQQDRQRALEIEHAGKRLETADALLASCTVQLAEAEARYDLGGGGIETIAVARAMMRRAQTEVLLAKIARTEATLE